MLPCPQRTHGMMGTSRQRVAHAKDDDGSKDTEALSVIGLCYVPHRGAFLPPSLSICLKSGEQEKKFLLSA